MNATKDDSEVGGIQDVEEEEDFHCLDNKRVGLFRMMKVDWFQISQAQVYRPS